MKRTNLIACAMVLGIMAASPAKADLSIVRWNGSQWCQIWDNGPGNKPWPEDYAVVADGIANWQAAWAALHALIAEKKCGW